MANFKTNERFRNGTKVYFFAKVHFSAIPAPGRRRKHRRSLLYLENAQKCKNMFDRAFSRKVRFRHPRIGKTRVHVVNLQNGDFCDDFCEIFSFSGKCVSETGFFIDVYGVFAKNQKVILRKNIFAKFPEKFTKMANARFIKENKWVLRCRNAHFRTFATFPHFCVTKRPKCVLAYVYAVLGGRRGQKVQKVHFLRKSALLRHFASRDT